MEKYRISYRNGDFYYVAHKVEGKEEERTQIMCADPQDAALELLAHALTAIANEMAERNSSAREKQDRAACLRK